MSKKYFTIKGELNFTTIVGERETVANIAQAIAIVNGYELDAKFVDGINAIEVNPVDRVIYDISNDAVRARMSGSEVFAVENGVKTASNENEVSQIL